MNRRSFFKFLGGGLVATATMAEAGAFAEFMDWIRRAPAWSFASREYKTKLMYEEISAVILQHYRDAVIADNFFRSNPFRPRTIYAGGSIIQEPFTYQKVSA